MSGLPAGTCPFCGVPAPVPHETQEACIAALHGEIGRMRRILATLRPAGIEPLPEEDEDTSTPTIRLALD